MTATTSRTRAAARPGRGTYFSRRRLWGIAFVSPALLIVAVFFALPLGFAAWMSLTDWNIGGFQRFVGLRNYERILTDTRFLEAMRFTTIYTVIVTVATFLLGFGLALLVRAKSRRMWALRTMFYLPVVIGLAAASFIFLWLFNDQVGAVNGILMGLGLIDRPIVWLANPDTAMATLVIMVTWKNAGFAMIVLLIAMQAVPEELYEAARVDGAGFWPALRRITIPLILPTIALVVILLVVSSYLAFDQFYILTRGGPNNSTVTATYWIYNQAFIGFKFGYSTALSVVLLLFLLVLGWLQLRILRRDVTS
ncbi:sugar ABC transporter permease [soil metagenome]